MAEYKLHCFAQSGNAYKVALALELAGADWEPIWVDFFKGGARSPEFTDKNIMAEVPVLEHEGNVMSQSGVMLDYLSEKLGRFAASEPREALRWILWDNHKLTANLATWRFLRTFAPEKMSNPDVIAFQKGRAVGALKVLNAHLEGRDWIVGDSVTNADLSCCGYLYYPEPFGFDRTKWHNIDAWLTRLSEQPGWKAPYDLMPGSIADRA